MNINIFSIPPLASSILFLLLGVFIFLSNRRSKVNITFFLVCLSTFWWQFSWFILFNIQDEAVASLIVKMGYVGIILIPVTFFHFFISFLGIDQNRNDRYFLYFSYALAFIFETILFFTDYFVVGYYKYFWGFYPKVEIFHPVYLLLLTVLLFRIIYLLFIHLKSKDKDILLSK